MKFHYGYWMLISLLSTALAARNMTLQQWADSDYQSAKRIDTQRAKPAPAPLSLVRDIQEKALYTAASSCDFNAKTWACKACKDSRVAGTQLLGVIKSDATGAKGYYAVNSAQKQIIYAFRGTSDREGWGSNLDFVKREFTMPGGRAVRVHRGFWEAFDSIRSQLDASFDQLRKLASDTKIVVTGHSLGAAIAQLVALHLHKQFPGRQIYLYTYGSPRVGDDEYSAVFNSASTKITHYRFVNADDGIARVPPSWIGFAHTGTEIWAPNGDDQLVQCQYNVAKDRACSDSTRPKINKAVHSMAAGIQLGTGC